METEDLQLVEPSLAYRDAFLAFATECATADTPYQQAKYKRAIRDVRGYIRRLQGGARGANLPAGHVPGTTYWLVRGGRDIVATSNLRHRLTPHLEYEGGYIGYGVRPSERRKGYGTAVCRLTLEKARAMGMKRVLITCDTDNLASARIIEKNGGVLENRVVSHETGKMKNRYWVDL